MNNKSPKIVAIVNYLRTKHGTNKIIIKDHWDADENAIGLIDKTNKFLAYISTSNENENDYYLALENPPLNKEFPYSPVGEFDHLTLKELEQQLSKHFHLTN